MKWPGPRLHPAVVVLAATHFLVDGYGNIFTPLLPLFILSMNLSLAAAGTLQMCFLLANSVAQLAFGSIADRWRPRVLLLAARSSRLRCFRSWAWLPACGRSRPCS